MMLSSSANHQLISKHDQVNQHILSLKYLSTEES